MRHRVPSHFKWTLPKVALRAKLLVYSPRLAGGMWPPSQLLCMRPAATIVNYVYIYAITYTLTVICRSAPLEPALNNGVGLVI